MALPRHLQEFALPWAYFGPSSGDCISSDGVGALRSMHPVVATDSRAQPGARWKSGPDVADRRVFPAGL